MAVLYDSDGTALKLKPMDLWATGTAAVNVALTVTLPAAGVGIFHFIIHLDITKYYSIVGVAGAPVIVTTTNLPGNPAFSMSQAATAAGLVDRMTFDWATPIRSSVANIATTIICPQQLQTIWRVNVGYFVGTA